MPEAPATSIGAACGRLFRLRKAAMLSRHSRLWLSFPPSRSLPKINFQVDAVEHFDAACLSMYGQGTCSRFLKIAVEAH